MDNTQLNLTTSINVNPNCAKYQSDAMRDFADVLYMPFAHETSFDSFEGAEMQFAFRKKVFDCMDTLNKHSQLV